jgi:hypothetical protein
MMKGPLWEGVLPGVLRDLYVGRKTGLLALTRDQELRGVRFHRGHIINADTNAREDRLGDVLVRHGLLTSQDLKRATGFVLRDKKRLGHVLIELGLIDQKGLEGGLALHVQEVLSKAFSWSHGSYEFQEEEGTATESDITLRVSTGELILQATRSVKDPDVVRYNLGDVNRVLGLSSDPLLRFQRITLTPADAYVLSRIDGTVSAHEVLQLIPLPEEETQRSLFGLLSTGVVEFLPGQPKSRPAEEPKPRRRVAAPLPSPPSPPATPISVAKTPDRAPQPIAASGGPVDEPATREVDPRRKEILEAYAGLETRTHFELLGIATEATEAQVQEAYFRLAKRCHPDAHHDPALSDLREKLEAVFSRLGEAYEVLRSPRIRASYERGLIARTTRAGPAPPQDPLREVEMAEEAIQKATASINEERYWEAIQLLEPAISRVEGRMKQHGRVLLARAYSKNPIWVKQGEELLLTVVHEDPQNVEAYLVLGGIYRSGGLNSRAITVFRKVLELSPDHEEALAHLEAINTEGLPGRQKEGLITKFFKKPRH